LKGDSHVCSRKNLRFFTVFSSQDSPDPPFSGHSFLRTGILWKTSSLEDKTGTQADRSSRSAFGLIPQNPGMEPRERYPDIF
jgi:hypothetical protein